VIVTYSFVDCSMLKIVCNGEVLEQVNTFRYLGAIITSTGDCIVEIRSRLGSARSAITSLNSMWKDRALSKELKARLMRILVRPVATYGCETWTLKVSDRKRISAFEMTSYRRMLRISRRRNATSERHSTTEIAVFWAQGESRHGWISGKKRRGRPRRRWTDDIRDWMGSSVAECTKMAQERELWRTMVSLSQVIDLQQ